MWIFGSIFYLDFAVRSLINSVWIFLWDFAVIVPDFHLSLFNDGFWFFVLFSFGCHIVTLRSNVFLCTFYCLIYSYFDMCVYIYMPMVCKSFLYIINSFFRHNLKVPKLELFYLPIYKQCDWVSALKLKLNWSTIWS